LGVATGKKLRAAAVEGFRRLYGLSSFTFTNSNVTEMSSKGILGGANRMAAPSFAHPIGSALPKRALCQPNQLYFKAGGNRTDGGIPSRHYNSSAA
jgi:hypothetical protein